MNDSQIRPKEAETESRLATESEAGVAGGFVLWIMAYATIMVCLFAFRDGIDLVPNLAPLAFDAF